MKIKDIVVEAKRGKKPEYAKNSDTGEWQFRDMGVDRIYNLNRIMMASAMHDGQGNHAVDMDESSWVEKNNVARPYTEAEHNMMKGAFKTVKSHYKHTSQDHRSREQDDVNKVSPTGRTGPVKRKS